MVQLNLDNRSLAQTYDVLSDNQFENGIKLIELLDVKPGDSVLDIGCGTGRLGFHVLEKIGPTGRFVGIDPLQERVRIANEKNRHANALFGTGVGEDLSFLESSSVDVVYLSAVFHWIIDKEAALRDIFRILKPDGRVGITTGAKELAHVACFRKVTDRVLQRPPYNGAVNLDDYATARHGVTSTQLVQLLLGAGFSVQSFEIRKNTRKYQSGSDIVDFLESSTFGNYLNHVPEKLRGRARRDIEAEFEATRGPDGIPFTGYTVFAVAEKLPEK
ncbi:MAG: methyltransferase domain-containing protein [Geobacter sp.]|nr:methyltransferase domain-containing protein [Geobacter sp.]